MNEWEWQLLEDKTTLDHLSVDGAELRVGSRVRLRPRARGDVLDIALSGQSAVVESLEQDYEGKNHVCVVLEDDPGRDLGMLRQPGHRFFFDLDEIELLGCGPIPDESKRPKARILVAGIGNIFLGDDGFGVEVIKRLLARPLPSCVKVIDFGIRGLDLAYALVDDYETTILVDAFPSGQVSGTVSLVEPDIGRLEQQKGMVDAHAMNPMSVLGMAAGMNASLKNILLVGCEPETLGGEEGQMGLSPSVERAVEEAVTMVISVIEKVLQRSNAHE